MPTASMFIIVSSATAYVDPSVQVHSSKCSHGLSRWYDEQWTHYGPIETETQAVTVSEEAKVRVGAAEVMWCDCIVVRCDWCGRSGSHVGACWDCRPR